LISAYAQAQREADAASKGRPVVTPEALRKAQTEQVKAALEPLRHFVDASYAGAAVPRPLKAFLTGQARALEAPGTTRETYLRRLEDVLLAVDAAERATGNHDAESVAKRLGDVADEVAEGCKLGLDPEKRGAASKRPFDRSARARQKAPTPVHAERAGRRHLAASRRASCGAFARAWPRRATSRPSWRAALGGALASPKPSFSSAVAAWSPAGSKAASAPSSGRSSQAHQQFEELMRELQQLSEEHSAKSARSRTRSSPPSKPSKIPGQKRSQRARRSAAPGLRNLPDYAPGESKSEQARRWLASTPRHGREPLAAGAERRQAERRECQQQLKTPNRAATGSSVSPEDLERASKS